MQRQVKKYVTHHTKQVASCLLLSISLVLLGASNCLAIKIIIDPLYGGNNMGPHGNNGLKAKDVTLDVALKTADLLEKKGHQVILTRKTDNMVPLEERVAVAKRERGDIFIGIGVNAALSKKVSGVETYYVGRKEIKLKGKSSKSKDKESVDRILADLQYAAKRSKSVILAHILSKVVSEEVKSRNRGAKQALFYTLVGSVIPSTIVFVDFISNSEEASKMASSEYREKVATSIVKAVSLYETK